MANLNDKQENGDDEEKDDWNNKKAESDEDDSTDKPNENSTPAPSKEEAKPEPAKPAGGKFVPRHLRGGDSSNSGPSLPSSSLINQGLRGPGGRMMRMRDPPKTESHSEFPTLGAAMKEQQHKEPEGFAKVQHDPRSYRNNNDNAGGNSLSTSNKFGLLN